jgi:mannose-1-phosphate guanylyltransferase
MMKKVALIIAGGSGTRFWPLSRHKYPKQFLEFENNKTLLNATIERLSQVVSYDKVYIVGNIQHGAVFEKSLPEDFDLSHVLLEPLQKNTGPAIAYAMKQIEKVEGDCVVGVFPADHHMTTDDYTRDRLELAYESAIDTQGLVTLGIKPTRPETGYGYIKPYSEGGNIKKVEHFVEKPNYEKAVEFLNSQAYYWNSGMFFWTLHAFFKALESHMPSLYKNVQVLRDWNHDLESGDLMVTYAKEEKVAIDVGLLEKASNVYLIHFEGRWDDLGTWHALEVIHPKDYEGNIMLGDVETINVTQSTVIGKIKPVTLIGVDNLVVVDTDHALLVCHKDHMQDIKNLLGKLKDKGREELL